MRNDAMQVSRYLVVGLLAVATGTLGGCSAERSLQPDGLPGEEYLVGGGMMIDWEAPTAGTVYLVEKVTGKIIETRSVKAGDSYSFSVASDKQASEFERMLGIKFAEARFLLYFQPDEKAGLRL
jgi:hypothetical protein